MLHPGLRGLTQKVQNFEFFEFFIIFIYLFFDSPVHLDVVLFSFENHGFSRVHPSRKRSWEWWLLRWLWMMLRKVIMSRRMISMGWGRVRTNYPLGFRKPPPRKQQTPHQPNKLRSLKQFTKTRQMQDSCGREWPESADTLCCVVLCGVHYYSITHELCMHYLNLTSLFTPVAKW